MHAININDTYQVEIVATEEKELRQVQTDGGKLIASLTLPQNPNRLRNYVTQYHMIQYLMLGSDCPLSKNSKVVRGAFWR